jgi:Tol biopolymer transport system component
MAVAGLNSAPAFAANPAGGQLTYIAFNAVTKKADIFLTDSAGTNTVNLTESLQVGNVNGFSWSPDGASLAFSDNTNTVYRLGIDSRELEVIAEEGYDPAWSPSDDTIVYTSTHTGNQEIYSIGDVNLTHSSAQEYHPVWTRDGKIIFFSNWEDPNNAYLYFMTSDGQNVHNYEMTDGLPAPNQICLNWLYSNEVFTTSWSPDYKKSVFSRDTSIWGGPARTEIVIQNLDTGEETRVMEADGRNTNPLWSPDGARIAFLSDRDSYLESGEKKTVLNLYVLNTDGSGLTRLTTLSAGDRIDKAAWRPGTGQTAVTETAGARPAPVTLGPVYPNPFNPSTTISFTLPAAGTARLAVYSVTGQMVRELVNGSLSAGEHRVVWDGRDGNGRAVSSGVYLSRLESNGHSAQAKLTLLR